MVMAASRFLRIAAVASPATTTPITLKTMIFRPFLGLPIYFPSIKTLLTCFCFIARGASWPPKSEGKLPQAGHDKKRLLEQPKSQDHPGGFQKRRPGQLAEAHRGHTHLPEIKNVGGAHEQMTLAGEIKVVDDQRQAGSGAQPLEVHDQEH